MRMSNHLPLSMRFFRLSGLLFLSLLLGGRASAQVLVCSDFIQTSLDFECKDTVKADEVLEGSYCCYDNYSVEIDKSPGGTDCDGIWDFNVVYGSDIGMTYCVRVSDPFMGSVCYSYVYIVDNTAPTITCPANQARNTDPGICKYATLGAEFDPASFQDNCPDNLSTSYMLSGSTTGSGPSTLNGILMNSGITTVKWKVTDPSSNSATCTFTVTVSDMEPPTITCPTDQVRNTDPGLCDYTTIGGEFDPLAFGDNCGGTSLNYGLTGAVNWNGPTSLSGFVFPPGQTTVTWVVGDGSNFDATCTFLVIISAQAPTVTCPGPQSRNTKPNQCHYTTLGSEFDPTVGNGCGSTSLAFTLSGATTGNGTTTLASTIFQKGQTTVTWTATDASNNTATCSFVVTVIDNQPPTITCPGAQSRNTNAGTCTYTAVGGEFNPTASGDNCSGTSIAYVLSGATTGSGTATLAGQVFQKGTTTVIWTVTDAANLTATCTFNILVQDGQPPTIACPGTQNRNANTGVCSYTTLGTEFDPLSFSDNCPGTISLAFVLSGVTTGSGATTLAGQVFQKGTTTVSWTATDAAGNPVTCTFNVIVKDIEAPTVSCPGAQSRNANAGLCTYTAVGTEFNALSVNDNCPGTTLAFALSGATTGTGAATLAGQVFQKGQTTVVWTATDAAGNPATCSFILTVIDNQGPGIGCVGPQSRNTNTGVCTYTAVGSEFNPAFVNDNCAGTSITYVLAGATTGSGANTLAGQIFQKGQTTVTWTVTDAANLTKACSFTVTVSDGQAPSVTCPGPQSRNTNNGVCTYTAVGVEFNPLAFGDNCPGAGIAYVLSGVTTGSGTGTLAGVVLNKGVTMVNWTVTDAANLTAVCTFNITVNDGQAPTITCPGSQTHKTDPNLCTYTAVGAEFNPVSVSSDNCSGTVSVTYTLTGATTGTGATTLAGKVFQKGQTTIVWTATDASGNPATCSFILTVDDLQTPTITCPGAQTRNTNPSQCTYSAMGTEFNPTAFSDNCPGTSISYSLSGATTGNGATTLAGKVFNKGLTTVTWKATDASNNTSICSFIVDVKDAEAPFFICPINQIRYMNAGLCTYTIAGVEIDPVAITDNCPGVNLSFVYSGATTGSGTATLAGRILNKGITTITWTVTDASNNTASCSFTVDVKDGQPPGIICPFNQTRSTNPNLCSYTTAGAEFNPIATSDNCPGAVSLAYTLTGVTTGTGTTTLAGKVFNKGVTTVQWTATDVSSNTAVCTFTVDVKDNEPPKFTSCPPVALYNVNMTPGCTITIPNLVNLANANATDNCPGLTKTQSPAAGTVMTVVHNQNVSVVITAKDAAGNTATCNRIVKAKDVTPPAITTCPPNRTVSLSPDCKITVPDMRGELVASDCSLPLTVTQNPVQGTVLPSDAGDVFTVTMTVKDAAGNAKTCTVVLTAEFRQFAYITSNTPGQGVAVINTASNTVVATVPMGNYFFPYGVCVKPDGSRVYITHGFGPGYVSAINTATNIIIATTLVSPNPKGICVSPDGSRVYAASSSGSVSVLNTATNQVIATISGIPGATFPCISPDGSRVYVAASNKVFVINTTNNQIIPSATLNLLDAKNICISPDGSKLYVTAPGYFNKLYVVNTSTSAVTQITLSQGPEGPQALCASPDGSRVYITLGNVINANGSVAVLNTANNQIIATIGVGISPLGISVTPDGNYIYVANNDSHTVSVINSGTYAVATVNGVGTKPIALGNFIGGPLCLSGNNQPPPPGPDEATPAGEDPIPTERALFPTEFRAMPNPFTDELTVAFDLETPSRAQVILADLTGRFVFFEKDNWFEAGPQSLVWNTEDLPGGAYLVGLKVDGQAWTYRKVMLIR